MTHTLLAELKYKLGELIKHRNELQKKIDDNNMKIQESQCYTDKILSKDEEDFKVFSPRKHEDLYRDELDQYFSKRKSIQKENDELIEKRKELDSMIQLLQMIYDDATKVPDNQSKENYEIYTEESEKDSKSKSEKEDEYVPRESIYLNSMENTLKDTASVLRNISVHKLGRINHKLDLSVKFIGQDPMRTKVELNSVRKSINEIMMELQKLIFELSPMGTEEQFDFKTSCEKMFSSFNKNEEYDMNVRIDDITCKNEMKLRSIYRAIMESLVNIKLVSLPKKVSFLCEIKDSVIYIRIEDDGKGILIHQNNENQCPSVDMIKDRIYLIGGKIDINSDLENGNIIEMVIPV